MELSDLLRYAVDNDASDVHVQAGAPPMLRFAGQIRAVKADPLTPEQARQFIESLLPPKLQDNVDESIVEGLDFSYLIEGVSRFRCSAYSHMGRSGVVMRIIKSAIPSIEDLNLPRVVHDIALSQRGLTLLTGTTGSGKSTTLAAMIELINQTYRSKVLTIEDPIEFTYENQKALICQLEVGADTPSFDQALRQALRQDPDVILVGELRDVETLRMALRATDTGHQVFSTVHSANAPQTIERIIAMFPPVERQLMLQQLASSIEAIISQRLVTTNAGGRRPAVEILRASAVTEKCILENRLDQLNEYIETGESNMQSFDQHLLAMYRDEIISGTEALRWSTNPEALAMNMRGIRRS
ncbi:MAG: twitching motility protein PilT [Phycisphaeraceae bacterium]|nr:twitching motility protein PilT [Phycisphaeraceae bacterium]